MTQTERRRKELDLLRNANKDDEYTLFCIDQMEKALNEFEQPSHSGMSHAVFAEWMTRLVNGLPISAITEENADWGDGDYDREDGITSYQSKRYSALFKDVDKKGKVRYSCVNNVYYIHRSDKNRIGFGTGDKSIWGLPKKYKRWVTLPFYPTTDAVALKLSNRTFFGKYIYLGEYK